jgi:hypothetical protein
MKIIITESQLKKLNEDITASRMIVYHRTGKKTGFNPSKNIADIGYNIGKGDYYGYGVYTTYDLESQLNNNMRNIYGNIIIESKILDISKFLIFNYDIAKKIYKSRYQFRDQLEQILGKKEWLNYKNNHTIKDIHYTLDEGNVEYTSKLARDFSKLFRDSILRKLNGMIFTGENDGNVLVVYNRRNIEPLRYSEDDGQTWTNVRNVKTYQRIKDSDEYKNDTEIQHILNKIENEGLPIGFVKKMPEKYQDYILNHLSKKGDKLNRNEIDFINNLKFFKKFGDFDIFNILNNSKDKEKTALEIIEMKGDRLTSIDIHNILIYFTIPDNKDLIDIDVLIRKIIEIKGEKLEYELVENLLDYSNDKDLIVSKIIEKKGDKLDVDDIHYLLKYSTYKDLIVKKIIEKKGDKLDVDDIHYLLDYSKNNVINTKKIISFGHMISEERYTQLVPLLQKYYKRIRGVVGDYSHWEFKYLTNDERIKYIEKKGDKLDVDDIHYLIEYSKDKDLIATKIIEVKGENLNYNTIVLLVTLSNDIELIKKTLLQKGIDYKLINDVITKHKIDTPLIPDNYQSMLQEIKRIKEIMI